MQRFDRPGIAEEGLRQLFGGAAVPVQDQMGQEGQGLLSRPARDGRRPSLEGDGPEDAQLKAGHRLDEPQLAQEQGFMLDEPIPLGGREERPRLGIGGGIPAPGLDPKQGQAREGPLLLEHLAFEQPGQQRLGFGTAALAREDHRPAPLHAQPGAAVVGASRQLVVDTGRLFQAAETGQVVHEPQAAHVDVDGHVLGDGTRLVVAIEAQRQLVLVEQLRADGQRPEVAEQDLDRRPLERLGRDRQHVREGLGLRLIQGPDVEPGEMRPEPIRLETVFLGVRKHLLRVAEGVVLAILVVTEGVQVPQGPEVLVGHHAIASDRQAQDLRQRLLCEILATVEPEKQRLLLQ
ncbi:hypothetical protein D3C86_1376310 [compost metagenome]